MEAIICGDGPMGRAIGAALVGRGGPAPTVLGRPAGPAGRHDPSAFAGAAVVFDASRGAAVLGNVAAGLDGGVRRFVVATTGWEADRTAVERLLREHGASAVAAANFSLGVALFLRLVETAADLFGRLADFEPYVLEWHRRTKADRPSGTALEIGRRILAVHPTKRRFGDPTRPGPPAADELEIGVLRAGASPGMHLVGFDAPGETIELRLTARDRAAYAAGALAAADWLLERPRTPGIHSFDAVVDAILGLPSAELQHTA
ncbi:MAG TPA: dihydrodipicolinate reductase C-terminal domain-containing protein [Candidatus Limnocylindrales bacterium]|nr:dihydrodipicolinate reductase C-terminal domain-containing protein [Candidatus Limnocylindrales bacterium]